jgi:hypothetical protein
MSAAPPRRITNIAKGRAWPAGILGGRPVRDSAGLSEPGAAAGRVWRLAILAGGLLGALLLGLAEFTPLFSVHASTSATAIKTVQTGSHHSYALIPIAVLAAVLAFGGSRDASRPALIAVGALGVVALVIALAGDLPDAHATGLVGSSITHYSDASSTPDAGLYLETLGAIVLIVTCGAGLLLLGPRRSKTSVSAS